MDASTTSSCLAAWALWRVLSRLGGCTPPDGTPRGGGARWPRLLPEVRLHEGLCRHAAIAHGRHAAIAHGREPASRRGEAWVRPATSSAGGGIADADPSIEPRPLSCRLASHRPARQGSCWLVLRRIACLSHLQSSARRSASRYGCARRPYRGSPRPPAGELRRRKPARLVPALPQHLRRTDASARDRRAQARRERSS